MVKTRKCFSLLWFESDDFKNHYSGGFVSAAKNLLDEIPKVFPKLTLDLTLQ